eukprot:gene24204-9802_t
MLQMGLALFSCINLMICWWEVGLFFNRKLIKEQHNAFRKKYEKPAMPEPMFGFVEVPVKEALTLKFWSLVWSTYSLMDPSYQDQTTFGFFVDVGNGFTTLLPTLLWALAMTWDVPGLSARTLGAIGLVLYYQEEFIMDVVGALEYDPELSQRQPHRDFLSSNVVFKEVVPITDPTVLSKIHQTYRIQYIKDVILPRALDDATYATLTSLVLFNNVEVVSTLYLDAHFLPELFLRLEKYTPADEEWRDLVAFLQEFCTLCRHLPQSTRQMLFNKLVQLNLYDVLTRIMKVGAVVAVCLVKYRCLEKYTPVDKEGGMLFNKLVQLNLYDVLTHSMKLVQLNLSDVLTRIMKVGAVVAVRLVKYRCLEKYTPVDKEGGLLFHKLVQLKLYDVLTRIMKQPMSSSIILSSIIIMTTDLISDHMLRHFLKVGNEATKMRATDILSSIITHDCQSLRNFLLKQADNMQLGLLVQELTESGFCQGRVPVRGLSRRAQLAGPPSASRRRPAACRRR